MKGQMDREKGPQVPNILNPKARRLLGTGAPKRKDKTIVGTPDYLCPEILMGEEHGNCFIYLIDLFLAAPADWWALGVLAYEFLVGVPPFSAETLDKIFENIINHGIRYF
jgi:serine/threonine protein kinase